MNPFTDRLEQKAITSIKKTTKSANLTTIEDMVTDQEYPTQDEIWQKFTDKYLNKYELSRNGFFSLFD